MTLVLALLLSAFGLLGATAEESLEALLAAGLDPDSCYRVRDAFLEREDVKFYFTDGLLIFGEPVAGRVATALFIADEPVDTGELLVIPPTRRERQSLARFVKETVLNEKFRTAMLFFTDDTAEMLRAELDKNPSNRPQPDRGRALAERWSPVLRNIVESLSLRILHDLLADVGPERGFFAAAIGGGRLGRFDVVIDAHMPDQVSVGQVTWKDGARYYETWCRFEGRTYRDGTRKLAPPEGRILGYDIAVDLDDELAMQVHATADFVPGTERGGPFAFEISNRLTVNELLLDGEPAEFIQLNQIETTGRRMNQNVVLAMLPAGAADRRHRIEFLYSGKVVAKAGEGVYFVHDRGDWYPRVDNRFTDYRLTFTYPDALELVATGAERSSTVEAGRRTTVFESEGPIRLAGFNLGAYESAGREVGGFRLEVKANRRVENRLQPKLQAPVILPPLVAPTGRRGALERPRVDMSVVTPAPNPSDKLDWVLSDSAEAFEYFVERLGPPPSRQIVISPIPGEFGQGFPGLVYAATRSYFQPTDPPLSGLSPNEQTFFSKLLRPHEISHQWWGNRVSVDSLKEAWILESLATYSSLLLVEHREGAEALNRLLDQFLTSLLAENEDGETAESMGSIVLGERLRSSRHPFAERTIVYEKGAWIIHMLRQAMGDERFFAFLRELPRRFDRQSIDTETFRRMAAEFLPDDAPDPELTLFFEQWVYDTGIPRLSVDFRTRESRAAGTLRMRDTPEHFVVSVPIVFEAASGKTWTRVVKTDGEETPFEFELPERAVRASVDPGRTILAVRR